MDAPGTTGAGPGLTRPAPVPYDPEVEGPMRRFIDVYEAEPLVAETILSTRARFDASRRTIGEIIDGRAVLAEDHVIPGPPGAPDLVVSVLRPALGPGAGEADRHRAPSDVPTPAQSSDGGSDTAVAATTAGAPGIFSIHGGGMVTGHRYGTADELIGYVLDYGVVAATVEYRLAPESPHPGPAEDCFAGLTWFCSKAAELGVDPERIIVMGASAGGGLAAAMALMARDRGGPRLVGQLLVCPMIDDRNDTVSARQWPSGGGWDAGMNETGWRALLGDAYQDPDVSPYAAPARATNLADLPPAYIEVGAAEIFRDEDTDYALRIWAAGGQAELHVWGGGCHGFTELAPQARVSVDARRVRRSWLERTLGI